MCFNLKKRVLFVLRNLVSLALLHLLVLDLVFGSTFSLGKELLSLKSCNTSGACVGCQLMSKMGKMGRTYQHW